MTMTDLEDRVRDALDGAARHAPEIAPPPLEVIEAASHRQARAVRARRSAVVAMGAVAVLLLGLVAVRWSGAGGGGDVTTAAAVGAGQPVKLGLAVNGATVEFAADSSQAVALQKTRPTEDVSVPWLGYNQSLTTPYGGVVMASPAEQDAMDRVRDGGDSVGGPALGGGAPGPSTFRNQSGDPTSNWFTIQTLTGLKGSTDMPIPLPVPASTVRVGGGKGWFNENNVVDIQRFAWDTANGQRALLTSFGLSREQIVGIAAGATPDAKGNLVARAAPPGYSLAKAPAPTATTGAFSKIQYALPDHRFAEVSTVVGGADVLDGVADSMKMLTNRLDSAVVRGQKALISTSNNGRDSWVVWREPDRNMVVVVHALTRFEELSEILGAINPIDPATWSALTAQHPVDAAVMPKQPDAPTGPAPDPSGPATISPGPAPKVETVPLPPSAG